MWFPSVQILETESLHKQPTHVTDLRNWYLNRHSLQNIRWPLQHTWLDLCLCEICINAEQKLPASVTEWGKHRGFNDNSFWVWIKPPIKTCGSGWFSYPREANTLNCLSLCAGSIMVTTMTWTNLYTKTVVFWGQGLYTSPSDDDGNSDNTKTISQIN